jgi:hypothetical protein
MGRASDLGNRRDKSLSAFRPHEIDEAACQGGPYLARTQVLSQGAMRVLARFSTSSVRPVRRACRTLASCTRSPASILRRSSGSAKRRGRMPKLSSFCQ